MFKYDSVKKVNVQFKNDEYNKYIDYRSKILQVCSIMNKAHKMRYDLG